ncbi:MAG TPA: hypothetical protein VF275_03500 [Gammaproteobacteria bacterium]
MSEFNNRIAAQRQILFHVNRIRWDEELFGMSNGAIRRWVNVNNIGAASKLAALISEAADKLFFLSNKSQEQVTDEYKLLSAEVSMLTTKIASAVDDVRLGKQGNQSVE